MGFGGQTKPVFHKKVMSLRIQTELQPCHRISSVSHFITNQLKRFTHHPVWFRLTGKDHKENYITSWVQGVQGQKAALHQEDETFRTWREEGKGQWILNPRHLSHICRLTANTLPGSVISKGLAIQNQFLFGWATSIITQHPERSRSESRLVARKCANEMSGQLDGKWAPSLFFLVENRQDRRYCVDEICRGTCELRIILLHWWSSNSGRNQRMWYQIQLVFQFGLRQKQLIYSLSRSARKMWNWTCHWSRNPCDYFCILSLYQAA